MNNNYTYIIASIPAFSRDYSGTLQSVEEKLAFILSQLGGKDCADARLTMEGFSPDKLCEEFYEKAAASRSRFVKEFFHADLRLRNEKVKYLDRVLLRSTPTPLMPDPMQKTMDDNEEDSRRFERIFSGKDLDLLGREKAIDDFLWDKAVTLTQFEYFSLDSVLSIIARLCIIKRWLALDETQGKEKFKKLVNELKK